MSINRFPSDTDAEVAALVAELADRGITACEATHWANGGAGALDLARAVVAAIEQTEAASASEDEGLKPGEPRFAYDLDEKLEDKITAVARRIYGAGEVVFPKRVAKKLALFAADGFAGLPVCIAKTQYSFSTDASLLGAPTGHTLEVRDVRLAAGAGFVVAVCGDIMTMPGLSKQPAALSIDVDEHGQITGLF